MGELEHALGRRYRAFEYTGAADAEYVVVVMGAIGSVFRSVVEEEIRKSNVCVLFSLRRLWACV